MKLIKGGKDMGLVEAIIRIIMMILFIIPVFLAYGILLIPGISPVGKFALQKMKIFVNKFNEMI